MIGIQDLLRQNGGKIVVQVGKPADPAPAKPASILDAPGIWRKAANFGVSLAGHIRSGAVKATDEQVAARWAICSSNACGLFKATGDGQGQCLHKSCGCSLKRVGNEGGAKPHKLRWAEQKCPAGLWGPV